METFEQSDLHDAPLTDVIVTWQARTAVARLSIFFDRGRDAVPSEIRWIGVRRVSIPAEAPWGDSAFVNSHGRDGDRFWIEMQSGDVLEVWADESQLRRLD